MSYNANMTNLFYQNFKDTGVPVGFKVLIGLRWAISMVGFMLNFSLVFVTIRSKSLHGTCNFLIAANALCCALLECSLGIGLYISLSGIDFVTLRTCFHLQAIPSIFGHATLTTMLAIGLDRIVSIFFSPFWHLQEWPIIYLIGLLSLCLGYSLYGLWHMFLISIEMPQVMVMCTSPGEVQQGDIGKFLYRVNVAVNLALLLEYGLLWILFKLRKSNMAHEFTRRIIRSLTAITLLIAVCWVANSIVRLVLPTFNLSPMALSYVTFSFSLLPILSMASNAPLLFLFSFEYRRSYAKQFPRLFGTTHLPGSSAAVMKTAAGAHQIVPISSLQIR